MNKDSTSARNFRRAPVPEEISRRAYELWEREGRPEGRELDHWLQSEKELQEGNPYGQSSPFGGAGNDGTSFGGDRSIAADSRPRGSGLSTSRRGGAQGSGTPFEKKSAVETGAVRSGQRRGI